MLDVEEKKVSLVARLNVLRETLIDGGVSAKLPPSRLSQSINYKKLFPGEVLPELYLEALKNEILGQSKIYEIFTYLNSLSIEDKIITASILKEIRPSDDSYLSLLLPKNMSEYYDMEQILIAEQEMSEIASDELVPELDNMSLNSSHDSNNSSFPETETPPSSPMTFQYSNKRMKFDEDAHKSELFDKSKPWEFPSQKNISRMDSGKR